MFFPKMIWSSLVLVSALLFKANGLFDSDTLKEDPPYWVGDGYNVTWNSNVLDADFVNIVLRYGDDLSSEWTIVSNQSNIAASYMKTLGTDLSTSVGQLLISNGTMGQFRLEIPSNINNSNITSRSYNLTDVIPCYQTVIVNKVQGRVLKAGERVSIEEVQVFVRKETYLNKIGSGSVRWVADFVNVDVNTLTWTVGDSLGLANEPTMSPTRAPTMMPTVNNTNGNGTNASNPIAVASLTGGKSKGSSSATTPSPTTVYTTDGKNGKTQSGQKHGRRLLSSSSLSLKDITLGLSESNNNNNDDNNNYGAVNDCRELNSETWCEFSLKLTIPESAQPGGPFFFVVGVEDENDDNTGLQYYGVNGNGDALDPSNQFVVYNASNIVVDITHSLVTKYENVGMNVSLGNNISDAEIYVALHAPPPRSAYYYLECGAHVPSYYTSLGWKTTAENENNNTLPSGYYEFQLFYGGLPFIEAIANQDYYRFDDNGTLPFITIFNEINGTSAAAVSIKDNKNKFKKGSTSKIEFETSFNEGTELNGYVQQCDYTQTNYSMNDTGPCHDYTETMFNFTYTPGESVEVSFPKRLESTNLNKNSTVTNIIVSTMLCHNNEELTTIIPITLTTSSSKSNGLSAGAIVGIVCAGVLVLGLAAWWLCMKKGGGDQYRELDG